MEYTKQKELKISKLSLGTVQLGMNYGINNTGGKPDREAAYAILRTALDGGINVIDTASDYGTSEETIGDFLHENPQYKPIIVTKCHVCKLSLREQVERSLEKLGVSRIPVLMLHREEDMFDKTVPNVLDGLMAEGLVGRVGVSLNNHKYIEYVAQNDLYETVQIPLNMMNASAVRDGRLEKLHAAGKVVFVRSVFLQGLFFKNPENLPAGILQKAAEPLRKLRLLEQETGLSIAKLAFAFVRDLDGVSSLVLGCETPEQVQQNLALMYTPKLSGKTRDKILSMFEAVDMRVAMPWTWNE